jgi:hypothetical protein
MLTSKPTRPSESAAAAALNLKMRQAGVPLEKFGSGPLRLAGKLHFACPPAVLWPDVAFAEGIATWLPIITGGRAEHAAAEPAHQGEWANGSKRYCDTIGMGTLDETILHWDQPRACAYNLKNPFMPITRHAGVMLLEHDGAGGTWFYWLHYHDPKGVELRHVFRPVMVGLMNFGLRKLVKKHGGRGGAMAHVG